MMREIIGIVLIVMGLATMVIGVAGTYRFKYVLNRMHSAAIGDTLGLPLILLGLMVLRGVSFASAKMLLIVVFMWLASPAVSHLIARAEVLTCPDISEECEVIVHDDRV